MSDPTPPVVGKELAEALDGINAIVASAVEQLRLPKFQAGQAALLARQDRTPGGTPYMVTCAAHLLRSRRLMRGNDGTPEGQQAFRAAIEELVLGLGGISGDKHGRAQDSLRLPAGLAAIELSKHVRTPKAFAKKVEASIAPINASTPAWPSIGLATKADLEHLTKNISVALNYDAVRVALSKVPRYDLGTRELAALVRLSNQESARLDRASFTAPEYDRSDERVKIARIEIESFRGSPNSIVLEPVVNDKPASMIIFGDNGSGKSTIVDGVEFALQGRVGRSSDLNGFLSPLVTNLVSDHQTRARVTLSDGTTSRASVERRADGRLTGNVDPIRPGFRLAPITLKRADILRFLDTDALRRGTVFLDYFPASADVMARRPDDEAAMLEEQLIGLRMRRGFLARKVAVVLGVEAERVHDSRSHNGLVDRFLQDRSVRTLDEAVGQNHLTQEDADAIHELRIVQAEMSAAKKRQKNLDSVLNPVTHGEQAAVIRDVLNGVAERLTMAFQQVTRSSHVAEINVAFGETGPLALDVVVQFSNGETCFPQQVFSEGYRDLLALLFFVNVAQEAAERGQARVLILDDVFQSVDATVRAAATEYILDQLRDWQLIFTIHDRLWLEQVLAMFKRRGIRYQDIRLRTWTFDGGVTVESGSSSPTNGLQRAIQVGLPASICAEAGKALEGACNQLTWCLSVSVIRREGDKYTLGDLWPAIKKSLSSSSIADLVGEIDHVYQLRNLAGAHANDWAESLSLAEAEAFGATVTAFIASTWCDECRSWVQRSSRSDDVAVCRCSKTALTGVKN